MNKVLENRATCFRDRGISARPPVPPLHDFIAYHSTDIMGKNYNPKKGQFQIFSRKARAHLQKSIGKRVWVITGTRNLKGKMIYQLAVVYRPDLVRDCRGGLIISGVNGHVCKAPIELNNLPWFRILFREFNRFSFGFSAVRNPETVQALHRLVCSGALLI